MKKYVNPTLKIKYVAADIVTMSAYELEKWGVDFYGEDVFNF